MKEARHYDSAGDAYIALDGKGQHGTDESTCTTSYSGQFLDNATWTVDLGRRHQILEVIIYNTMSTEAITYTAADINYNESKGFLMHELYWSVILHSAISNPECYGKNAVDFVHYSLR